MRAETLYDELMRSSTETVVLHGDLHHWNILRSEREPYLVIDPKGYFGDPGYEVGAFLANYPDASCEGCDRGEVDVRRVEIMAAGIGYSARANYQMGSGFGFNLGEMECGYARRILAYKISIALRCWISCFRSQIHRISFLFFFVSLCLRVRYLSNERRFLCLTVRIFW